VADLLLAAGGALVLWLGVTAVTGGRMTLGTLLVVLAYLSSLYGPIRALARLARTLARGAASRERILEVLDSGEVVPEAADPVQAAPPRHGLALRGVWFAYTEGAPVLRHLDLEVAAGERVCVVGPTGAGKSTLLALLQRFYDPEAGVVELDGTDLRDLELGSLRRQLALVPRTRGCWTGPSPTTSPSAAAHGGVRGGALPPEWTRDCWRRCRRQPLSGPAGGRGPGGPAPARLAAVDGPRAGPPATGQPGHGPVRPWGGAVRAGHRQPGLRPGRRRSARAPLAQLAGPPPSASGRNPEVPASLDQTLAALLAPDPAGRPVSAAQVLALLAAAMPADAGEEDRPWPAWATGRLDGWQASAMERPPLAPRSA